MSGLVRLNLHLFQTTLRFRGITPSWVTCPFISTVSTKSPTGSLVSGKVKRTRCRIESFRVKVFSAVLGQSATNTEPVSHRPTDRTKSPAGSLVLEG